VSCVKNEALSRKPWRSWVCRPARCRNGLPRLIPGAAKFGRRWTFDLAKLREHVKAKEAETCERAKSVQRPVVVTGGATRFWGRVRLAGAKPVRWSLETDDPKIARERYKAGKAKYIATVNFGDANHTFEEAYAAWDKDMQSAIRSGTLSPKTVKRYIVSIEQLAPELNCDLHDITVDRILDIVAKRKAAGASHATIKRDLNALSSVLGVAVAQRWMPGPNPTRAFFELNQEERGKILREKQPQIILPRDRTSRWSSGDRR
jgi:hypothetical protein